MYIYSILSWPTPSVKDLSKAEWFPFGIRLGSVLKGELYTHRVEKLNFRYLFSELLPEDFSLVARTNPEFRSGFVLTAEEKPPQNNSVNKYKYINFWTLCILLKLCLIITTGSAMLSSVYGRGGQIFHGSRLSCSAGCHVNSQGCSLLIDSLLTCSFPLKPNLKQPVQFPARWFPLVLHCN